MELPREPSGGDSDHAAMPLLAPGQQNARQRVARGEDVAGLPDDAPLLALPLAVQGIELAGETIRLRGIPGQQQPKRKVGVVEPSSRVDPRSEAERDFGRRHGALDPGDPHQRPEAWRSRLRERLQAERGDHAVLAFQRHHVGDRAQTGDPQQRGQRLVSTASTQYPLSQLEGEPGPAEMGKGIAAVLLERVDLDRLRGKVAADQMMVGHDHVDPAIDRREHRFGGRRSAVHGDDERRTGSLRLLHLHGLEAIALRQPVREDRDDRRAKCAQHRRQEGAGSHAVHVVVADDGDGRAAVAGLPQALHGLLHAAQQKGIVQAASMGLQEGVGFGRRADSPAGEGRRQQAVSRLGQRRGAFGSRFLDPLRRFRSFVRHDTPPGHIRS